MTSYEVALWRKLVHDVYHLIRYVIQPVNLCIMAENRQIAVDKLKVWQFKDVIAVDAIVCDE